jgi:hypothetical protein
MESAFDRNSLCLHLLVFLPVLGEVALISFNAREAGRDIFRPHGYVCC